MIMLKILIIIAMGILMMNCFFTGICLKGHSMEPTLHDKDMILSQLLRNKDMKFLQRGDIIGFKTNIKDCHGIRRTFCKRIIGLPGDIIVFKEGHVYINGELLDEPYLFPGTRTYGPKGFCRVPNKHFYVLGDNRLASHDSRMWDIGCVPFKNVRRKAVFRINPFNLANPYSKIE